MKTFKAPVLILMATLMSLQLSAQQEQSVSGVKVLQKAIYGNDDVQPLYVVDGVVVHGKSTIPDPIWVEKVDVVKGDAATAEYGDQGVNGVVRITMRYDTPPIFSSNTNKKMTPYINSKIEWKEEYEKIKFRFTVDVDGKMRITDIVDSSHDALTNQVKNIVETLHNWESPAYDKGEKVVAKGVMTLKNPMSKKAAVK